MKRTFAVLLSIRFPDRGLNSEMFGTYSFLTSPVISRKLLASSCSVNKGRLEPREAKSVVRIHVRAFEEHCYLSAAKLAVALFF